MTIKFYKKPKTKTLKSGRKIKVYGSMDYLIAPPEKKEPVKTCSICKKKFVGLGNNPQPVRTSGEDRCCDDCNNTVVVPRRFREVNREIN